LATARLATTTSATGSYQLGFRVPLIVVSAYSPQTGYIDNEINDFGSVLRAIENIFNLPGGEGTLNFADARPRMICTVFSISI
jgi:phospholipase C